MPRWRRAVFSSGRGGDQSRGARSAKGASERCRGVATVRRAIARRTGGGARAVETGHASRRREHSNRRVFVDHQRRESGRGLGIVQDAQVRRSEGYDATGDDSCLPRIGGSKARASRAHRSWDVLSFMERGLERETSARHDTRDFASRLDSGGVRFSSVGRRRWGRHGLARPTA